ncbi:ArnT family glycosyltransferase [Mucilaginibacter polytrichastri]|nr:glycosyltransferase family 39 protein [Mucilaginibacter polytrichastri]
MLGWTVLNALQAFTLGLHSDEAYYWLYSRLLDWGYYDHPPMVAIFIRIGYAVFKNEFGLRMVTVISSTLAIRLLWLTLRDYKVDARQFILVVGGMFIFHIYGFITTPDAPLFFFTVLFYYLYQQYLKTDKWLLATLIGLTIACLLYSKYHAVLLITFTIAANIKLLKRKSFWLIPVLATVLFIPHIYWQVSHGYPSVNYHLFERSSEVYDFAHTYQFIPGQLLMAGPLIGWIVFYYAFKVRIKDAFIRTLVVNAAATFIFFLINTLKGNVQPHWTLIAFAPLSMLALIYFGQGFKPPGWFNKVAIANILLIILLRIALIFGIPAVAQLRPFKSFFGYRQWAGQIKQRAGNSYVIFGSGFQDPSKYSFYTQSLKGFAYDNRYYRRTQFDIWPLEDSLQHQRALYILSETDSASTNQIMHTVKGSFYTTWVNDIRTYQRINIQSDKYKVTASTGQPLIFNLTLTNPYPYAINFSDTGQTQKALMGACFIQNDSLVLALRAPANFNKIKLQPSETIHYTFALNAPKQKGKYDLIFSIRTTPFPGGRNSRIINFTVQ